MTLPIYLVDAFTDTPFRGNPAAVCIVETPLASALMQQIAAEMAVSETAFLCLSEMNLRWFTPQTEVALCGHGTLAVAKVLAEQNKLQTGQTLTFTTLSGPLSVTAEGERFTLDFPETPALPCPPDLPLLAALGIEPGAVSHFAMAGPKVLIVLEQPALLRQLAPDMAALRRLPGRGVVVSTPSDDPSFDLLSRYFAPWVGVEEDPVTGSAHCMLSPYWGERLACRELRAWQASARGGALQLERRAGGRLAMTGAAVIMLRGALSL